MRRAHGTSARVVVDSLRKDPRHALPPGSRAGGQGAAELAGHQTGPGAYPTERP